jgi:hypothetical protein
MLEPIFVSKEYFFAFITTKIMRNIMYIKIGEKYLNFTNLLFDNIINIQVNNYARKNSTSKIV